MVRIRRSAYPFSLGFPIAVMLIARSPTHVRAEVDKLRPLPPLALKGAVELSIKSRLPLVLFPDQTNKQTLQIGFAAADFGSHAVAVEASSGGNPPASANHQWQR
jgi:hypothetical protein